jgi:hypothetical protein
MEGYMDWIDVNKVLPTKEYLDGYYKTNNYDFTRKEYEEVWGKKYRVLVYYWCAEGYTKITVGEILYIDNDGTPQWDLDDMNDELIFVTHWQPLPDIPINNKLNE